MPPRILFPKRKIESLSWSVCKFIPVYFEPHCHVKPGREKQYRGLISISLIDTFTSCSKTQAYNKTSIFKWNRVTSSPFLKLISVINFFVLSISLWLG